MSRHHVATHAYDYRRGWVRIALTAMTDATAVKLRDEGFTIVRSRRGWFGTRELPLSWYLRRTGSGTSTHTRLPVPPADEQSARLRDRIDEPADTKVSVETTPPLRPSTQRVRPRSSEGRS
ncbi:hypothetical protein M3D75_13205 [Microbacterium enclense]|uniref:hypothetical protein n=1 Tax=Microbacterium enclense TaxID=993073 RepID=UPI0021A8DFF6|nr:hypothetical protein [Microbacterium enclense]MCT2087078.1 hypothetical protein [Microbacterium enclense]